MTTEKTYGPWIKWDGGECPVPLYTRVEVKCRNGTVLGTGRAGDFEWDHIGSRGDIIEYRTITEQSDLEAAEQLLLTNDYSVIPPAKPLTFEDVTPLTEAPPEGTEYWVVSASPESGVYRHRADSNAFESRIVKRRMAYLDKEHAQIAAKHIFGLKGGEL